MSQEPEVRAADERLRTLVEIESPTGHREGIAECFEVVEPWVSPLLGRSAEVRVVDGVDHLYWPAANEGGVLILGHMDTVWPLGTIDAMPYRVVDGRASGPGTFDMKAGVVAAVGALERLESRDDISLLFTGDEEVGSITSRALIEDAAKRSRAVLIFEPSLAGASKVARRGAAIYRLVAQGRAAHAGLEPELGANALVEISRQVLKIIEASDPAAGTSVTPTVMRAGTTVNTVPEHAEVRIDARSWTVAEQERVDAYLRALTPENPDVELTLLGGINRPPMQREHAQHLYEMARAIAEGLGHSPLEAEEVGGGSDGNFTAALGIPTLDGLGPLGDGAHAPHEWVQLDSIVERSQLIAGLIERIRAESTQTPESHEDVAERNTP